MIAPSPGTPLVSVVMAVFNGERYLREAIDSIVSQTFADWEFIIVDDGSSDGTAGILAGYANRDARFKVLTQGNQGLIASLNTASAVARGRYIARFDADDISVASRLERQVAFLNENPDVAVVGGQIEMITADGFVLLTTKEPLRPEDIAVALPERNCMTHTVIMMRTGRLLELGGYRKAFVNAEDYDLWLRMLDRWPLANLPETLGQVRRHGNQVSVLGAKNMGLSYFAAQVAYRSRAAGRPDSFDAVTIIDEAALGAAGIEPAEVRRVLYRSLTDAAWSMEYCGQFSHSATLLREAVTLVKAAGVDRAATSRLLWNHARMEYRCHFPLAAIRSALRAAMLEPWLPYQALRRRLSGG